MNHQKISKNERFHYKEEDEKTQNTWKRPGKSIK
jgi:hypothetical protein